MKKPKVVFHELAVDAATSRFQEAVRKELGRRMKSPPPFFTFRSSAGGFVYHVRSLDRRVLDRVHAIVKELETRHAGRPAGEPTRQLKCRVPERSYDRLAKEAKRRGISPSRLARELICKGIG